LPLLLGIEPKDLDSYEDDDVTGTWEELRRLVVKHHRLTEADYDAILAIRDARYEAWLTERAGPGPPDC